MGVSKKFLVSSNWINVLSSLRQARKRGMKFAYCKYSKDNYAVALKMNESGLINGFQHRYKLIEMLVNHNINLPSIKKVNKYRSCIQLT